MVGPMTTVLNGLIGGLVIGLIAGLVTRIIADQPTVAGAVLDGLIGPEAASSRWLAFVVWLVYGGLGGGALIALELYLLNILAVPPTTAEAVGVTFVWSILLFGLGSVVWRTVSPHSLERVSPRGLLLFHLVYGGGLGLWIRMT